MAKPVLQCFLQQNRFRIRKDRILRIHKNANFLAFYLACVAGVKRGKRKGIRAREHDTREGGGRRGTPARKPLFSPCRLLIKKKNNRNNATVND